MTQKEIIWNNIETLRKEAINDINALVQVTLPSWFVTSLNDSSLRLGFNTGEFWDNGKAKTQDFDIYFGNSWTFGSNDEWKFQMNTCCFGSFEIEGSNVPKEYFIGVGEILSNTGLQSGLKEILKKFDSDIKPLKTEISQINRSEENEARRIREEKEKIEAEKKFNADLKKISENPNSEAVIRVYKDALKTTGFSYRNKPAELVDIYDPSTYNAYCEAKRLNRNLSKYANYSYKAIEVSKIKKIA